MELALELDDDIYERLQQRAQNNGFESTDAYCQTVLRTVLEELEAETTDDEVEQRLEDLGYLN
jgi:hypothetical protein